MADIKLDILARLDGIAQSTQQLEKFARTAEDGVGRIESSVAGAGRAVSGLRVGLLNLSSGIEVLRFGADIARSLGNALASPIAEAAEAEDAVNGLNRSLALTGQFSAQTSTELQELAKSLADTSRFTDEAVLGAAGLLQTLNRLSSTELAAATEGVVDLASALGVDLDQAAKLVSGAIKDGTISMRGVSIAFQKGATDAETMQNVLDGLRTRFGGAAAADIKTFSGALALLGKSFDDLEKAIGRSVVQNAGLRQVVGTLTTFMRELEGVVDRNSETIGGVLTSAISLGVAALTLFVGLIEGLDTVLTKVGKGLFQFATGLSEIPARAKAIATLDFSKLRELDAARLDKFNASLKDLEGRKKLFSDIGTSAAQLEQSIGKLGSAKGTDAVTQGLEQMSAQARAARDAIIEIPDGLKKIEEKFKNAGLSKQQILIKELNQELANAEAFAAADVRLRAQVEQTKAAISKDFLDKFAKQRDEDASKASAAAVTQFKDQQERIKQLASGNVQEILVGLKSTVDLNVAQIAGGLSASVLLAISEGAKGAEKVVAASLGAAADAFLPGIGGAVSQLVTFLNQDFAKIAETVDAFVGEIPKVLTRVLANLGPFLAKVTSTVLPIVAPLVAQILQESLPLLVESLSLAAVNFGLAVIAQVPLIVLAILENIGPPLERIATGLLFAVDTLVARAPEVISALILKIPELASAIGANLGITLAAQMAPVAVRLAIALQLLMPQVALAFAEALIKHGDTIALSLGKAIGQAVIDGAVLAFQAVADGLVDLFNTIPGVSTERVTIPRPKLAEGGTIPKGFSGDTFTADLSSGEEVLSQDRSSRLEDFLEREEADPTPGKLDQIIALLARDSGRPVQITMRVGEEDLARVLTNLNQQGFRTA